MKVREFRDAEKDARVEEMVEECVIQLQTAGDEAAAEADSSTWKPPGALAQRGMRKRAGVVDQLSPQNHPTFHQSRRLSLYPSPSAEQETLSR